MRTIIIISLFILASCQSTKQIRCDIQRLEDEIYEVKLNTLKISEATKENLLHGRKGLREMECIISEVDDKVLCCLKEETKREYK